MSKENFLWFSVLGAVMIFCLAILEKYCEV